ncbi:coiled-coil domain-containing protein 137 [Callorhinchus milii]|uniref:Coiled-coil domain-containing protein 137 n=1 Tax=Callorhinchus milii TaxID=7868 RepID=A0A4W3K747_CALMI|nr:coiled-coil domain-containing protein 137 [Callorhinchus milii]|eukprot:gi/632943252/ref/XP_007886850.1/ PREDICTED: coiled-coil domain-containing protein 137 [Callorhinchus milii]
MKGTRGAPAPGEGRRRRRGKAAAPSGPVPGHLQLQRKPKEINMRPKNVDDQEIPYKLREIMRSKEKLKKRMNKPKKNAVAPAAKPASGHSKPQDYIAVPKFKQKKGESERAYIQRMDRESQYVMFLTRNQEYRCPEMQEPKQEESLVKPKSERKKNFDRRRVERLNRKKVERNEVDREKEMLSDPVSFGEVVLQPPTLTAKPRKSQQTERSGQKALLLKALFEQNKSTSESTRKTPGGAKVSTMSMARQRMMLEERERVVKAYRELKKRKQQNLSKNKDSTDKRRNPE